MNAKQIERVSWKLERLERDLDPKLYSCVGTLDFGIYETTERLRAVPDAARFSACALGRVWGGAGAYAWFRGEYKVPPELDGKRLFLMPGFGGYEGLMYVDGEPYGNFAQKITFTAHGNHYCKMFADTARAGERYDLAVECYAGHDYKGKMPEDDYCGAEFRYMVRPCKICVRDELVWDFYFNLKTLNELFRSVDENSFTKGRLSNLLTEVDRRVLLSAADCDEAAWRAALASANEALKAGLYDPAHPSVGMGEARIIGHSHMDTAWLWTREETVVKCARTYSHQLSLMRQYPEYLFVQSSPYHLALMKRCYPSLYVRLKEVIAAGRYEPNGGGWIECDCNMTSGESMIRQFVWGQRFTRAEFGYTADTFWLPDTFGYSGAIPQIMRGCGISYFCTTKLEWADIDLFPYESFVWKGIDGTSVFAHFNKTNLAPAPEHVITYVCSRKVPNIRRRDVTDKRLLSFGYGDGGGGPEPEMLETARRCADLEGCPKVRYQRVGDFMKELSETACHPPVWDGELYLGAHRGTLTTQHRIKRGNRKAEFALRNAELSMVGQAVAANIPADESALRDAIETVLVNQFHDILPGTCIPEVHERVYRETEEVISRFESATRAAHTGAGAGVTLWNPLSFARTDVVRLETEGMLDCDAPQQRVRDLDGRELLAVAGLRIDAMASRWFAPTAPKPSPSAFTRNGSVLTTPFAVVTFAPDMTISSFVDRRSGTELCGEGRGLNVFLLCEDYPMFWDNWDIDADTELKYCVENRLEASEVVADGAVEYRIRNVYRLGERSRIVQDMIFYAGDARVDFDTRIEWADTHRLLKVAFDTALRAPHIRAEVQFGHVLRPTTRNTTEEQEKFEAVCHKFADLSEHNLGAAILNDCKYGLSVEGGSLRLSLIKSGTHPDPSADHGTHRVLYAFLPHTGFSAENVVRPAYELNAPALAFAGRTETPSFLTVDAPGVIVETVKPCEDTARAYIVRLYECENSHARATLRLGHSATEIAETNMLEEPFAVLGGGDRVELSFRPFEIKTLRIAY